MAVSGVHGTVRDPIWVGVGRRFLPVPRAQLVRGAGDGLAALLPAAAGTPVHAVAAGTVADVDGEGGIAITGADRWRQHYVGLAPDSVTGAVGAAVRAGTILGRVSEDGRLEVRLSDDNGRPVDAVEALIGLPDPAELGLRDIDGLQAGPPELPAPDEPQAPAPVPPPVAMPPALAVDPDELDRELVPTDPFGGRP